MAGGMAKYLDQPAVRKTLEAGREIGLTGSMVKNFAGGAVIFTAAEMLMFKESMPTALRKGVVDSALWTVAPGIMTGLMVGSAGFAGAKALIGGAEQKYHKNRQMYDKMNRPFQNSWQDTERSYTMRQAAVQAIQGSKLNARSAIGGEARLMHRPWQSIYG